MKASDSSSRNTGIYFFIPFPFPNLPFHRRESQRELEHCEIYQTSNIISLIYISWSNFYWGGKPLHSKWKSSLLLDYITTTSCPSIKSEKTNGRREGEVLSLCLPPLAWRQTRAKTSDWHFQLGFMSRLLTILFVLKGFNIFRKLSHWYFGIRKWEKFSWYM